MPGSPNFFSADHYHFIISDPEQGNIQFNVQEISGLGFSIQAVDFPWNSVMTKRPGDMVNYNEMSLSILLDDKLKALQEIFNHIHTLKNTELNTVNDQAVYLCYLKLYDNLNHLKVTFKLHNAFFTNMSDLELSSTRSETTPLVVQVTLSYDWLQMEIIPDG